MKLAWKIFSVVTLCLVVGTYLSRLEASPATQTEEPTTFPVQSSEPVASVLSRPVSSLPPISHDDKVFNREINTILNPHRFSPDLGLTGTDTKSQDPLAALSKVFTGRTPSPIIEFEGLGTDGFTPPDTVGEVGPNHYIQMVNVSFRVFDKTGNPLTADLAFNTLFAGSGLTACQNENDGDPIVLYDELADRWLLSQFAVTSGTRMCIAISQTGDPTGSYHLYQFDMPDFPDYFKFAVWPDAYYMTTNTGFPNQYYAYAFDRDNMLAGQPATFQFFNNQPNMMLPADLDGSTPPPAGTPGYFYTMLAEGYPDHPAGVDRLRLYEFDVDWDVPANSTFTIAEELPIADYNYTVCGFFVQTCIPQPGTAQTLDSLSYWPMWRFAYRNLGSYEAMVGNFTVDLDGTDKAAIRWFELRNTGSDWDLHQEGTHAPDSDHRWMGSIAMDGSGNIALGYSVSSATTVPAIRYATRLANDPLGTLQAEHHVISGGSQTGPHPRWGDYSAMSVDPADNCTFWYTTQYHDVTDTSFNWNTRIVAFRLPECTGALFPDFALQSDPTELAVCTPDNAVYDINVLSIMDFTDLVDLSLVGNPAGTSVNFSVDPVTPPGSSVLTIGNTGSAAAGSYNMSLVGISAPTNTHTITLGLDLYDSAPGTVTLTTPADGATGVSNQPTLAWNGVADAANYHLEVAIDPAFSLVVYEADEDGTSHALPTTLTGGVTYYWRVTAENVCGDTTSSTFSFTVVDPTALCRQPNLPINDNQTTSDSLVIPSGSNITDLNVVVKANHTYVGDTSFTLVHVDTGTSVTMIDRPGRTTSGFGCANNNIDVVLDDEGVDGPVENQCAADPALFGNPTPNNPLSAFDGQSLTGTWTLQATDAASGDTGTVIEWCLDEPGLGGDYNVGIEVVGSPQSANAGTAVEYPVAIFNQGTLTDTYDITVDSGWPASVSSTSVTIAPAGMEIVTLTVNIPLTEATGAMSVAEVTATSQANASTSGTDTAETHVLLGVEFELFAPVTSDSGVVNTDVVYTAYITNTGIAADTYDLSLTNDLGWTVSIDQPSVTLNPGEGAELEITVSIPNVAQGVSSSTELYAESDANAGVNDSIDFVTTAEGYEVELFAPVTAQATDADTTVTYTVDITNTGAVADSFTISVMSSEGWPVEVDQTVITLTAGATGSVEVMVTVPMTASGGTEDTTTVTAVSDSAPTVSDSVDLATTVNNPVIDVSLTELNVSVGMTATATQTLTIMNLGGSDLDWEIVEANPTLQLAAPAGVGVDRATSSVGYTGVAAPAVIPAAPNTPHMSLAEGFDDITTLPGAGWAQINNSNPVGSTAWFQGNATVFPAFEGAPTSYIGANFNNTSGTGTISNWLITPELTLQNGSTVSFYTRIPTGQLFPDRLELRMSTAGSSTDVGSTETSVGDFDTLLLSVNPDLGGDYPTAWTQFTATISGLSGPTQGRLALRYFVTNGGPTGANSNYIGIDSFNYAAPENCIESDTPWLSVNPTSGTTEIDGSDEVSVMFDSTGYALGVYTTTLCINSNDPDMSQYIIPVTMTVVEATYGMEVMADTMEMTGTTGTTITYTIWVTNTGNVNDTFAVELSGHTWDTWASHSSINLAPGEMGTLMVMVTVPATATHGITDTTMVMITSNGDDTVSEMMHLTTTAVVPAPAMMYIYLPVINREP